MGSDFPGGKPLFALTGHFHTVSENLTVPSMREAQMMRLFSDRVIGIPLQLQGVSRWRSLVFPVDSRKFKPPAQRIGVDPVAGIGDECRNVRFPDSFDKLYGDMQICGG